MDDLAPLKDPEQRLVAPATPADPHTTASVTQNLIKQNKALSILYFIQQWRPTGLGFRLDLPIENLHNRPLLVFRIHPVYLSLYQMAAIQDKVSDFSPGVFAVWDSLRSVFVPMSAADMQYDDVFNNPDNIALIETDDMCDLTWWALHHMFWKGQIDISLRILSNTTSQGRLVFTRLHNVSRPRYMLPSTSRVPMNYRFGSQSNLSTNGFDFVNICQQGDILLSGPYLSKVPFRSMTQELTLATELGANSGLKSNRLSLGYDYHVMSIAGLMSPSAGASSISAEIWIKAGEDFEMSGPIPPSRVFANSEVSHLNRRDNPWVISSPSKSTFIVESPHVGRYAPAGVKSPPIGSMSISQRLHVLQPMARKSSTPAPMDTTTVKTRKSNRTTS